MMKTVTDVKGLSNLGTATTKRIRARPPQGGTGHLEMYLISKEKQRLGQELAHLDQRRERIQRRIAEIGEQLVKLRQLALQEDAGGASDGAQLETSGVPGQPSPGLAERRWKAMPLEY